MCVVQVTQDTDKNTFYSKLFEIKINWKEKAIENAAKVEGKERIFRRTSDASCKCVLSPLSQSIVFFVFYFAMTITMSHRDFVLLLIAQNKKKSHWNSNWNFPQFSIWNCEFELVSRSATLYRVRFKWYGSFRTSREKCCEQQWRDIFPGQKFDWEIPNRVICLFVE